MTRSTRMLALLAALLLTLLACAEEAPEGEADPDAAADVEADDPAADDPAADDTDDPPPADAVTYDWMAVPAGPGVWYVASERFKEVIEDEVGDVHINLLPGGGASNVMGVHGDESDFGLTQANTAVDGLQGNEPFEEEMANVRQVAALFPAVLQYVVLADSGIETVDDLRGARANLVDRGSGSELTNRFVFETLGLSYDDLRSAEFVWFDTAVDMMRDGQLDANLQIGPAPHPYTMDLATATDIAVIEFSADEIERLIEANPGLVPHTLPGGVYPGVDDDVQTVASPTIIIASADLDDDVVYEFTRTIVERWDDIRDIHPTLERLEPENLAAEAGVPLHPGAERYFEEAGLLD